MPTDLISQARHGDAEALSRLLNLYRNYLRMLARVFVKRHLQAKVDPSDLVQETYLRAHHNFSQFRGATEKELIAWLRRIMANTGTQVLRHYYVSKRRDIGVERSLQDLLDQSDAVLDGLWMGQDSSPSQQATGREARIILVDAISRLPDDYREATILHHLEGKSLRDVAQAMGRTVSSVNALLARALVRLRAELDQLS